MPKPRTLRPVLAGIGDNFSFSAALGAGAGGGEYAHGRLPPLLDGAGAAAVGTGLRIGARSRAGTLAALALFHPVQGDLLLAAESRFLEGNGQTHPQALAPLGTGAGPGPASEASAEKAAENIAQVAEVKAAIEAPAVPAVLGGVVGVHARKAELVIPCSLVAVAENLIGLIDLFEPGLSRCVAGIQVRVVLLGQLAVGFFDIRFRRALLDAQNLIIITFLIRHMSLHIPSKHSKWGGELRPRPIGSFSSDYLF